MVLFTVDRVATVARVDFVGQSSAIYKRDRIVVFALGGGGG